MIITDKTELKQKCEPCSSVEEGEEIAARLLKELTNSQNGIGIAAPQIGINKQVCVINVPTTNNTEPIILINPKIVESSEEMFGFMEGCLSFPGRLVKTMRHKSVTVEADNHTGKLYFEASKPVGKDSDLSHIYECACVQHEIDHLDGITMFERELKQKPAVRRNPKIGRNDKVQITNGTESKTLKYKKAEPLIVSGEWQLEAYAE